MSIKDSATIDVGYPIYAAKFINGKSLLVAGGGGEGNNGIPNKITVIRNSFKVQDKTKKLQRFREIELPGNEDSPMCLDIAKSGSDDSKHIIMIGCNQSTQLLKTMNINNNLRKYSFTGDEHLRFIDAAQLEEIYDVEDIGIYPKRVSLCPNENVGCFMTSEQPSFIYVFNPETLDLNFKYKPDNGEIVDFQLNPFDDGKTLCLITSSSIEVISAVTSNKISSSSEIKSVMNVTNKFNLSKVRFLDESTVIVAAHDKSGGISLIKYVLSDHKVAQCRLISKKAKAVTALDVSVGLNLIALAGNDTSVILVRLSDLKPLHTFKGLHKFALTDVSFSPRGDKVASVSAANSVHIMKIPSNYSSSRSPLGTIMHYLLMSLLMAVFAIVLQKCYENGQLEKAYHVSINYYQIGSRLAVDNGKMFYSFVKQKIQGENIDGDDTTREYFTVEDWDASKISDPNSRTIALSSKRRNDKDVHTSIHPNIEDTVLVDSVLVDYMKEISTTPPSTTSVLNADSKSSSERPEKLTPSTEVTKNITEYGDPSQGSTGSISNPSSNAKDIETETEENEKEDPSLVQSNEANMLEVIDNAPRSDSVKEYPSVPDQHPTEIPETHDKIKDDESSSTVSPRKKSDYYSAHDPSNGDDSKSSELLSSARDALYDNEKDATTDGVDGVSHGTSFPDDVQPSKTNAEYYSAESRTPSDKQFSKTTSSAAGKSNTVEPSVSYSHDELLEKESMIPTNSSETDVKELLNVEDLPLESQTEYGKPQDLDTSSEVTQKYYTDKHSTDSPATSERPTESEMSDHATGKADQDDENSDEDYSEEEGRNVDVDEDVEESYTVVHTPSHISTSNAERRDLDDSFKKKGSSTLRPKEDTLTHGSTKKHDFATTSLKQKENSRYKNTEDYKQLNYQHNFPTSHPDNTVDIEDEEEEIPRDSEDFSPYDAEDEPGTLEPEEEYEEEATARQATPTQEPVLNTGPIVNDESKIIRDETESDGDPYDIETETKQSGKRFSRTVKPTSSHRSSEELTTLQKTSNTPVSSRTAFSISASGTISKPKELTSKLPRLKETILRRATRKLPKTGTATSRYQDPEGLNDQFSSSTEFAGKIPLSGKKNSGITSSVTDIIEKPISATKLKPSISSHTVAREPAAKEPAAKETFSNETSAKETAVSHSGVTPRHQSSSSSESIRKRKTNKVATKSSKPSEKTDQRASGNLESSLDTSTTPPIAKTSSHIRSGKRSPRSTISSSSTSSSRTPSRKYTRTSRSSPKRSVRTQRDEL